MKTHATDVTNAIRKLPFPDPPSDFTVSVLARIARLDDEAATVRGVRVHQENGSEKAPDWQAWVALGGMAAGVVIAMPVYVSSADIASFTRGGITGLAAAPDTLTAAVSLAAAFGICLVSLFLPLRTDRPTRRS
jgi:hypothetical protein